MSKNNDIKQQLDAVLKTLDDYKAIDVTAYDVQALTPLSDVMVFCTGTSSRHVKTLSDKLVQDIKSAGLGRPRLEADSDFLWVLVDCGCVIVHVMQSLAREYYKMESLWNQTAIAIDVDESK